MITVRDVTSLVPVAQFKAHGTYITRVLLSPDVRHLATCSADHTARIWAVDLESAAASNTPQHNPLVGGPPPPGASSSGLLLGAAGSLDAEDSDPEEADGFELEQELDGHQRWVWDCAFSADSAYLVTACSDHYARLWELQSKNVIRQYNGHHRGAVCVALNDYSEVR